MSRDTWLPVIRETVAGVVAIIFVLTFLLLVKAGYASTHSAQEFAGIKELIAIVNAVVGVIIGYYFSRMTTEARAERAESTAEGAVATAARANEQERAARSEVTAITADGSQAKVALSALRDAARQAVVTPKGAVTASGSPDPAALVRLDAALRAADRVLER